MFMKGVKFMMGAIGAKSKNGPKILFLSSKCLLIG